MILIFDNRIGGDCLHIHLFGDIALLVFVEIPFFDVLVILELQNLLRNDFEEDKKSDQE